MPERENQFGLDFVSKENLGFSYIIKTYIFHLLRVPIQNFPPLGILLN